MRKSMAAKRMNEPIVGVPWKIEQQDLVVCLRGGSAHTRILAKFPYLQTKWSFPKIAHLRQVRVRVRAEIAQAHKRLAAGVFDFDPRGVGLGRDEHFVFRLFAETDHR